MKKYSIGQFAKEIGVTIQTLRNWDKTDKLNPNHVSPSGHRYYSQEQLESHLNIPKAQERSETCEENTLDILIQVLSVFSPRLDTCYRNKVEKFIGELKNEEELL